MLNSFVKNFLKSPSIRRFCTATTQITSANQQHVTSPSNPEIIPLQTQFPPKNLSPRQVWIENLNTIDEQKLGIIELHPNIFAETPRIDVIHQNIEWQRNYRFVSYAHTKTRSERKGGGRKPWPQKGLGRARHGSIRSPLFLGGGVVHGPRSPTPHFYMLPFYHRLLGLTSTLSVKLAQDDLHVIQDLEIPSEDPEYIKQLIETRLWGPSVLFVDQHDIVPRNITLATDPISHVHIQPVYGLNCYSMLKYETLVLTVAAVHEIHSKLLQNMNRADATSLSKKFQLNKI